MGGSRATLSAVAMVPLSALRFHPRNIRTDLGDLRELAESIRLEGVLVPVTAHRTPGGGLQLLDGHRRWAASDMVGLKAMPTGIVERTLTDDEAILAMLAYDKRQAIDVGDRAAALKTLNTEFGYSWSTLAERLGLDEAELAEWRKAKPGTAPVLTRPAWRPTLSAPVRRVVQRTAPRRPGPPRVKPRDLHAVIVDFEGQAPADMLVRLRDLLGGWTPAGGG